MSIDTSTILNEAEFKIRVKAAFNETLEGLVEAAKEDIAAAVVPTKKVDDEEDETKPPVEEGDDKEAKKKLNESLSDDVLIVEGKSTKRLVKQETEGDKSYKLYRDADWEEFVVQFFKKGVHQSKADYHTDDKGDAQDTAKYFLKNPKL